MRSGFNLNRSTQAEDVLNRLFAEEVVDAEDGALRERRSQQLVQRPGRGEVVAERFFDHHPAVGGQLHCGQGAQDRLEDNWRQGEIDGNRLAGRADGRSQLVGIGHICLVVIQGGDDARSNPVVDVRAVLSESVGDVPTKSVGVPVSSAHTEDGGVRQEFLLPQLGQRGNEVTGRQVSRRAENDKPRRHGRSSACMVVAVGCSVRPAGQSASVATSGGKTYYPLYSTVAFAAMTDTT